MHVEMSVKWTDKPSSFVTQISNMGVHDKSDVMVTPRYLYCTCVRATPLMDRQGGGKE